MRFLFSIAELQELRNSYNSARGVFPSILLLRSLLFACFLLIDNSNLCLSTLRELFFPIRVEEKKHENSGFFDVMAGSWPQ